MEITIKIKDSNKATAFLNFLKSLDFINIEEKHKHISFPTMSEKEVLERVEVSNVEIKEGKTISHEKLYEEFQRW